MAGPATGSLDFAAAIKRLNIRCDLAPQDLLQVARRDADAVKRLRREYAARRAVGLDHTWMTAAALARVASLDGGGRFARVALRSIRSARVWALQNRRPIEAQSSSSVHVSDAFARPASMSM